MSLSEVMTTTRMPFSLATGIAIGLSSLVKQSYLIFLLPLLVYAFLRNLKNKKSLKNLVLSVTVGALIAVSYYAAAHYEYYHFAFKVGYHTNPFYYLETIFRRQLLPVFFFLFILSLSMLFKKNGYFFLISILLPVLLFSLSHNKQDRFILPVFPYIAIIISGFIWSLVKIRKFIIPILILFSLFQYFLICYQENILRNSLAGILSPYSWSEPIISEEGFFSRRDEGDWQNPIQETLALMNLDSKTNEVVKIMFIGQEHRIYTSLEYYLLIKRIPAEVSRPGSNSDLDRPGLINRNFNGQILQSDFIIIENLESPKLIHVRYLLAAFNLQNDKFKLLKNIKFPNAIWYSIYKKKDHTS